MPKTLTIAEAQAKPSQVIADACNGEDIIITRNNMPILHLQPIAPPEAAENKVSAALYEQREKAIAAIKAHRKNAVIGPPMTIEEIISARDEGRR